MEQLSLKKNSAFFVVLMSVSFHNVVAREPVFFRDPSVTSGVPLECEFYMPHVGDRKYLHIYSGNGRLSEYYHFLIDFAPRLAEALANSRCDRGSMARLWVRGGDKYEHYHLTSRFYEPCAPPNWEIKGKKIIFEAHSLEEAKNIDLSANLKSMQPHFDFLFGEWGPPLLADMNCDYGKPNGTFAVMPPSVQDTNPLPYPLNVEDKREASRMDESWSKQPRKRLDELRQLGWRRANMTPGSIKWEHVLIIKRGDSNGFNRRHLSLDFHQNATQYFASHGIRTIIANLTAYSMKEQVHLFAHASLVLGIHGAGLSNIVFSKPGTPIFELQKPGLDCYRELSHRLGHHYEDMQGVNSFSEKLVRRLDYYMKTRKHAAKQEQQKRQKKHTRNYGGFSLLPFR